MATAVHATRKAPTMTYNNFGRTGLMTSPVGFGCYRVTAENDVHRHSLELALRSGINVIDTSTNYADGGSEVLVGQALTRIIDAGELKRQEMVVVSKVGYLQGRNYEMSQTRRSENRPIPDLVTVSEGLEHCIHPEFIASQLTDSLKRLNLETLDVYLLHNPEYYLDVAHKNGLAPDTARQEYLRRIRLAFAHLELEVKQGRIRWYGVSSNTFPVSREDHEFTDLSELWEIAISFGADHHFRVMQFPMNLLETGGITLTNQPGPNSVLEAAVEYGLAVMINRPLNAFSGHSLFRLADIQEPDPVSDHLIIARIGEVSGSESRFWRRILPTLQIPDGTRLRVKEQICIADTLKHYWRNISSYERWRQVRDGHFYPRMQGVTTFLQPYCDENPQLQEWMTAHETIVAEVFQAIGSYYAEKASRRITQIKRMVAHADPDWALSGSLSQKAVRALRSTQGISTVLVGMRHPDYVADILEELARPCPVADRKQSWLNLK